VLVDIWEGTDPRPEVERFCELWGIEATILIDDTGAFARELDIRGVPTNVLVDADGTIAEIGASELDALERAVDRLLGRDDRTAS
jgi:predicted DsbA family dithiol-disulfide isomerase